MQRSTRRALPAALFLLLLASGVSVRASQAKVEPLGAPPEGAPAGIRSALASGFRVMVDDKLTAELWPSREVALRMTEKAILGANYGQIAEGALVGLVRLPDRWIDFRGKPVAAGIYTLRYAIQPADGNHMGVSEFRDFLVLAPVSADADSKTVADRDALYGLGRKASGTSHPAVMSLVLVPKAAPAPSVLKSTAQTVAVAARAGALTVGLVVKGHAEN